MDKTWIVIFLAVVGSTWGGWMTSVAIGAWKQKREDETGESEGLGSKYKRLREEFEAHKLDSIKRFDKASEQTSDAWSYVQGLESKFIREFSPRELTDERFAHNKAEHERFSQEISKLVNRRHINSDRRHEGPDY